LYGQNFTSEEYTAMPNTSSNTALMSSTMSR